MLRATARLDLLILDDWGPEPFDAERRRDLLEIVEDRYKARYIIVTSQLPSTAGMRSSAIPRSPTPSSTASSTTPIASNSRERASAKRSN
jgi:DNA replication protein DnaC